MTGSAGVLALVLAETVAGSAGLLFLTPLWNEVRRGFFKVSGTVLLLLAVAAWGSAAAGRATGSDAARWALWLSLAFTAVTFAWLALLSARAARAARLLGILSVPLAGALLVAMAAAVDGSFVTAFLQLAAGAAFMGAVIDGLLLGHWYLTDRGLTRRPINRFALLLLAAVVAEAAAVAAGGFEPTGGSPEFNPLLTAVGLASWLALGMVGLTAVVAVLIRMALRGARSTAVQAATGFFYVAVITAFTGELAAKVRFLP